MDRRRFIKLSSTASVVGLMPFEISALVDPILRAGGCDLSGRKIVLINLAGANDGLNTLVPIDQYSLYSSLRPNILIPNTGINAFIHLDSTLASNQQVGLHPSMTGFKTMYDQGVLRVIQGVGYPSQNKSHFASTDLYMTGNDGNSLNNGSDSGWIGRFMEIYYQAELAETYPLAVQIGSVKNSLGFHGIVEHGMSINLSNQDPSGFYSVISGLGGLPPTNIPTSDYGTELEYIIQTDQLSNQYANAISNAFNSGTNTATYPNTSLANQLKTVAKLISGGLESKVYMVRLNGFDTHSNQVYDGDPILGRHNDLLTELSDAVASFYADINGQSFGDDVIGLTYSEFGRKVKENGSNGTDHGEIAPMFVFGNPVEGGMSGINPDLTEATANNNYQIETVQHDYRSVFGTLLQNFLGADNSVIDTAFFNHTDNTSFTDAKVDELLKDTFDAPEECYSSSLASIREVEDQQKLWSVYPVPCSDYIFASPNGEKDEKASIYLYDSTGMLVYQQTDIFTGNPIKVDTSSYANGTYILKIKRGALNYETHQVVKI